MAKENSVIPSTFLYFAYGGDMFTFRLHMHCPTAEFITIARIDNYRLDFINYSKFWGGPSTTIVPTANAHVWGVVWKVNKEDLKALDNQKELDKRYYAKYINVLTPYLGSFKCRSYIQRLNPLPRGDNADLPVDRWPSWMYKEVLILGALEHELPECYIQFLMNYKDNGKDGENGCFKMFCHLRRHAMEEPCECWVTGRIPRIPLKLDANKFREKIKNKIRKY